MNILSVDTTTKVASVSLKKDNKIYTEKIDNEITHSEKFLPLIDKVLKKSNLSLKDIDKYLILNGPGSFTGIRISLATIKAITYVNNKDIFSISSLEALAYLGNKKSSKKYIITFLDAKNDRVYFNIYKVENNEITPLDDIYNEYLEDTEKIIDEILTKNNINKDETYTVGNIEKVDLNTYPTTEDLIEIYENIKNKEHYTFNTYTLNANYARPSQAERVKNGNK